MEKLEGGDNQPSVFDNLRYDFRKEESNTDLISNSPEDPLLNAAEYVDNDLDVLDHFESRTLSPTLTYKNILNTISFFVKVVAFLYNYVSSHLDTPFLFKVLFI